MYKPLRPAGQRVGWLPALPYDEHQFVCMVVAPVRERHSRAPGNLEGDGASWYAAAGHPRPIGHHIDPVDHLPVHVQRAALATNHAVDARDYGLPWCQDEAPLSLNDTVVGRRRGRERSRLCE